MAIADPAYGHLPEAVEQGVVSEDALDVSVRRVLEAKLRMGLFEEPFVDEDRAREVLGDPAHREVARIAAERSAVLLRNEGDLLPLDTRKLGSIAVIGPLADSRRDTLGPWCFDYDLDETVTVLEVSGARPERSAFGTHRASVPHSGSSRRCSTCSATRARGFVDRFPAWALRRPARHGPAGWFVRSFPVRSSGRFPCGSCEP